MKPADEIPRIRLKREIDAPSELLADLRRVILAEPAAAQAIYSSLIAEGRRFAATPEGKLQLEALRSSVLVQRARLALELSAAWMLEEEAATVGPASLLDALFLSAAEPDLELKLDKLFAGEKQ